MLVSVSELRAADDFPKVGDKAAEFELQELFSGEKVRLTSELKQGPVVLVVLRGYPGYQCPACSRQVGSLIQEASAIQKTGARVILVYPGLGKDLELRAKEFFMKHKLPEHFRVVTDPDYKFTNAYRLRWDAPRETAYPSTFVIQPQGKIVFAQISKTHGDRAHADVVLKTLQK